MKYKSKNCAFVDGSFNPATNVYGYGGYLLDQVGKKHILKGHGSDPEMAKLRNVAGEILGSEAAIKKAIKLGMKELTIYFDYWGIAAWPMGFWKPKHKRTKEYAAFCNEALDKLILIFEHVKGHSGIPGNVEADRLAKEAVGIFKKGVKAA